MSAPVLKRCRSVLELSETETDSDPDDPCFDEMTLRELTLIWDAKRRWALRSSGYAESDFDTPVLIEDKIDVLERPISGFKLKLQSKSNPDRQICQQKVSFSSKEGADAEKILSQQRNSSKCLETTICADVYFPQELDNPGKMSSENNTEGLCALNQISSEVVEVEFWDTLDWPTDDGPFATICPNDLKLSGEMDVAEDGGEHSTNVLAEVNLCKESIVELRESNDAFEVGMEASGTVNSPSELDGLKEELSEQRNACELECLDVNKNENVGMDCCEDQTSSKNDDLSLSAGYMKTLPRQVCEDNRKNEESTPVVSEERISGEALADFPERFGVGMRNTGLPSFPEALHFSSSLVCRESSGSFGCVSLCEKPVKSCARLLEAGSSEVINHDSCVLLSDIEMKGILHANSDSTCSSQEMCEMQSIQVDELLKSTTNRSISLIKSNASRKECRWRIWSDNVQQKDSSTHQKDRSTYGANVISTSLQNLRPCHMQPRRKHLVGKSLTMTEKVSSSLGDDSVRSDKRPHFDTGLIMRAKHIPMNLTDAKLEMHPERFLSSKVLFPASQRKLCPAAAIGDMGKSTHLSKKTFGKTRETIPLKCTAKSDNDGDKSSPLVKTPGAICTPIQTDAQKAVNFSKQQMGDIEYFAGKLLRRLNYIRRNIERILCSEASPLTRSKLSIEKMRKTAITAYELEEATSRWLSTMARDSSRFCKIMNITRNEDTGAEITPQHQRKIVFADEAGGMLCHVKTISEDSCS